MKMKDIEQELTGEVDVPPTTVSVSPRHIDNGTVHCCRCPIALAIKDELGVDEVFVCENEISTLHSGKRKHYQHTEATRSFIATFDSRWRTKPFEFELVEAS